MGWSSAPGADTDKLTGPSPTSPSLSPKLTYTNLEPRSICCKWDEILTTSFTKIQTLPVATWISWCGFCTLRLISYITKLHYVFSSLLYACLGLICLTPMFCSLPRHSWRISTNRRDHAPFRPATPIVRGCLWVSTPTEPKDLETVTAFSGSICCRSHQFTSRVMCTFWDLTA